VIRRAPCALALVAAGCATSPEPYQVDAVAELAPVAAGGQDAIEDLIRGPIEALGIGIPPRHGDSSIEFPRTLAAYRVHLPRSAAPWIRLYTAPSCAEPGDSPQLFQDLGVLRQVDNETHFFARDVVIGDHTVDIDIHTVTADVTLDGPGIGNLFDQIAVVQAPGDGGPLVQGTVGLPVPAGGPWLACGKFTRP